jgi:hypothetical protein
MSETTTFHDAPKYDMQAAFIDPLPLDDANDDNSWSDEYLHGIGSNTHNDEPLEPTPIGSNNIEVVERVSFAAASWLNDGYLSSFLTLLQDPYTKVPHTVSTTVISDEDSFSRLLN